MPRDRTDDKSTSGQVIWLGAFRQQAITWANVDSDLSPGQRAAGYISLVPIISLNTHITSQPLINVQDGGVGSSSHHNSDVIMSTMASQIISLTIVYSTVYSGTDERKHQSSASLAFVRGIHRSPVNSPHKGPVTRKIFPVDNVLVHQ